VNESALRLSIGKLVATEKGAKLDLAMTGLFLKRLKTIDLATDRAVGELHGLLVKVPPSRAAFGCGPRNKAARRSMIAWQLRCGGRPDVGQCLMLSIYLSLKTPQQNSSIKLDVDAAG
jgi:hypothetical protein